MRQILISTPSTAALAAALAAAAALGACNKPAPAPPGASPAAEDAAALPMTAGPGTPEADAPAADALPPAPPAPTAPPPAPAERYAWLDDAAALSDAIGEAPPDWTFDYGGVRPWVWQADDRAYRVVEPVAGGYRYYFYRPGQTSPFLVREGDLAYAFEAGRLAAVFDHGRPLAAAQAAQRAALAGRMLARAEALRAAAASERRQSVAAATWAARAPAVAAIATRLADERAHDADWRRYHDAHADQQQQRWRQEKDRRRQDADDFSRWRQSNFRSPPPTRPPGPPPAPAAHSGDRAGPQGNHGAGRGDDQRHGERDDHAGTPPAATPSPPPPPPPAGEAGKARDHDARHDQRDERHRRGQDKDHQRGGDDRNDRR